MSRRPTKLDKMVEMLAYYDILYRQPLEEAKKAKNNPGIIPTLNVPATLASPPASPASPAVTSETFDSKTLNVAPAAVALQNPEAS